MFFGAERDGIHIQMLVIFKRIDVEQRGLYHWTEFFKLFLIDICFFNTVGFAFNKLGYKEFLGFEII